MVPSYTATVVPSCSAIDIVSCCDQHLSGGIETNAELLEHFGSCGFCEDFELSTVDLDLFVKVEPTLCQVRKRVSGRDVRVRHIAARFQRSTRNYEFVIGKRFDLDAEFI